MYYVYQRFSFNNVHLHTKLIDFIDCTDITNLITIVTKNVIIWAIIIIISLNYIMFIEILVFISILFCFKET